MPKTSEKYKTDYLFKKENDRSPIVFIHGVGLAKEIWSPQIDFFKDYNILTYDLIGHGKTPLEKTQLNFEDFVKQLLNLINELEIKKIHLVGFSLVALIAGKIVGLKFKFFKFLRIFCFMPKSKQTIGKLSYFSSLTFCFHKP